MVVGHEADGEAANVMQCRLEVCPKQLFSNCLTSPTSSSSLSKHLLMEYDDIVWIKEKVPNDAGLVSQLPTSITASVDSSSPQDKVTVGNDVSSHITVQFFNGNNKKVPAEFLKENEEDGNSISIEDFDITEYEKKLYDNAKQTINLIGDLCNRSEQITEQQKETLLRLEEKQQECQKITEKMEEVARQNEQLTIAKQELEQRLVEHSADQEESGISQSSKTEGNLSQTEWQRVDSSHISNSDLLQPNSVTFLQSTDKIVVTDQDNGLLLFSVEFGLIKKVSSSEWKWPQSAVYTPDNKILVSAMVRDGSGNKTVWKRNLIKFNENLEFVSRIEGPKWIENETVTREHLCIALNGYIYLCVTGDTFSALYELATDGQWTELCHKRSARFSNIQVLAVIDVITEVLVVEQKRGYIWLLSIRESTICDRNMIAAVEKPGALCIDDEKQLFIHDIGQSKIRLLEPRTFEAIQDVALTSKNLTAISAYQGLLVAVYCADKIIHLHRNWIAISQ
uniref:WD_REPEATS_REGION domain-containing protein n=1 Tax=Loa loa TaxID=7209 RepID=A0A1I7VZ06_LOALO